MGRWYTGGCGKWCSCDDLVWVIVTVVGKKKSTIDRKRNKERFCMAFIIECLSDILLDHMMMGTN